MKQLQALLERSSRNHDHLCPRQILGVRIGLAGLKSLGFSKPPVDKRLLVILETDGCFADGVIAATGCTVGHRTLRVEDYGKAAAVFVDTETSRAFRLAPALGLPLSGRSLRSGRIRPLPRADESLSDHARREASNCRRGAPLHPH